jgi:thiol-disulfide isomerase/thioredoxin
MKTLKLLTLTTLFAAAGFAQELSLADLASRQEFWPAQVTLKQPVRLQGRAPINAGQKLNVVSVRGDKVEVETPDGRSTFNVKADDTDVLGLAREEWKKLTPEQRALTYASLLQRKDLWTYRVKLTQAQNLSTGTMKPGEALILLGVEGNDLMVASEKMKMMFNVQPRETDLLESARKLLVNKDAFPGRITEDLMGKLTDPLTGTPTPLDASKQPRYFAFYRGASWCAPCRQFSPSLVKFYNETKPKHPEFEIIYISGDKTTADMRGYAKEAGFSWRAVVSNRQPEMQLVNRLFTEYIPQLVVTDRQGNVLIDSAKTTTQTALKQLDALLKKG